MSRLISFESHIIDDVMGKTSGKYSKDQIRDIFRASISYINNLCRYSENTSVSIPYIGTVACNLREMESRKRNLERLKTKVNSIMPHQLTEAEVLQNKIVNALNYLKDNKVKNGDMLVKWNKKSIAKSRKGYNFKEIQKLQDQEFYR